MEYIYAALLLHRAGKEINEENLKKVLEAAGVQVNEARVKALVAALENVNIDEVLQQAIQVPAAPAAPAAAGAGKAEEKKEEKKEKKVSEEEAATGLSALFA
ncbi:50S ribosomal protein P1 [Nanoarchaeota archaeon]|nr:MAG: 50S ribosomal protein P1 [Nanoarchaeota archaeon]